MARAVDDVDGARLPGRRRAALRDSLMRDGIVANAALVDAIRALKA